uniref:Uncharacterized protein n=1 Tax=Triticum urartu TaxID=4572 RepID=A0A8R7TKU7_TRIUA
MLLRFSINSFFPDQKPRKRKHTVHAKEKGSKRKYVGQATQQQEQLTPRISHGRSASACDHVDRRAAPRRRSPGLLLWPPGGAGERGEQVQVVVVPLRHRRRVRLRLQRRGEAPGHGPGLQRLPEGRRRLVLVLLARPLPEEGDGGGGGRGGAGEDGRGGAGAGGGQDGRLGLPQQPLHGLPVRLEPQLAGELEHARRAHDRHAHAPPAPVHLAVPVLGALGRAGLSRRRRRHRHHGVVRGLGRREAGHCHRLGHGRGRRHCHGPVELEGGGVARCHG